MQIDWDKIKELHHNYTPTEIIKLTGYNSGSVYRILRKIEKGQSAPRQGGGHNATYKRLGLTEEQYIIYLKQLYIDEKLSIQQISKRIGLSCTKAQIQLAKYCIQTRNASEQALLRVKLCSLTNEQYECFDGIMLGDGHLADDTRSSSPISARISYGCKFIETLQDISAEFSQLHFTPPWHNKKEDSWHFKSSNYADFLSERKRWYEGRIKIVPEDVRLTPRSFYWWFVGDGYTHDGAVELCTDNFPQQSMKSLTAKMNSLGFACSITSRNRLRISTYDSPKFLDAIIENNEIAVQYAYKFMNHVGAKSVAYRLRPKSKC